MAEWKISPELKAELEGLTLADVAVPIRVMVEIEPHILTLESAAEILTIQYGAEIVYQSAVMNYASIIVASDKVSDIAAQPWVKQLWSVPEVELVEGIDLPMIGLTPKELAEAATVSLIETAEYIGVGRARDQGYSGSGIVIAIVDSGIETTHPMLQGQVIAEKNFIGPDPGDRTGHGTWCASAVAGKYWDSSIGPLQGMAPGAKLVNAKAFEIPSTSADILMQALEWACTQGAHILSNSWGGTKYDPLRTLIVALREIYGAIFVFSAGNSGPREASIGYPGGFPEVVAVGSVSVINPSPDSVATFSSRGPNWQGDIRPDIAAPGGNVSPDECVYGAGIGGGVKCFRGTSMAAPHIAGALALILESGRNVAELYNATRDIEAPGKDNDSGYGIPRVDESVGLWPLTLTAMETTVEPPLYTKNGEPFSFEGTLKEKTGAPLGGQTVELIANMQSVLSTTTDAEGRWSLNTGLPKGSYKIYALFFRTETHSESRTGAYTVDVDATAVTVTEEPPIWVDIGELFNFAGTLADTLGNLLPDKTINLMQFDRGSYKIIRSTVTDSEGRWSFTHSWAVKGKYTVHARFEGNEFMASQSDDYEVAVALLGAFFTIEHISIPGILAPGTEFNLDIEMHNTGDDIGDVRIRALRHWNQSTFIHPLAITMGPCGTVHMGVRGETMPSVDATYTFWSQHQDLVTREWVDDDEKTVTIRVMSPQPEYTLTIISTTGGTTAPLPGSYNHPEGSTVRATAYPESGYLFDHWDLDGVVRTENPIDVLMDAGHILQAVFVEEPVEIYILTIETSGQGETVPAPGTHPYEAGSSVSVSAIPDAGSAFDHWEGDISSTVNPIDLSITGDMLIRAVFVEEAEPPPPKPRWIIPAIGAALIGIIVVASQGKERK